MPTIEIRQGVQVAYDELVLGIRQMDNQSLAKLASDLKILISQRNGNRLQSRENELLQKIKTKIPATVQRRQKQLYAKLQNETITRSERDELQLLHQLLEEKAAERILLMGELAKLRSVSITQLAAQLKSRQNYA